jgi:hypothetical protein
VNVRNAIGIIIFENYDRKKRKYNLLLGLVKLIASKIAMENTNGEKNVNGLGDFIKDFIISFLLPIFKKVLRKQKNFLFCLRNWVLLADNISRIVVANTTFI